MATGDPARAPDSAARGWRARARPGGESAPSSSIARGGPAARLHRRLARPCLASVSGGAAGGSGGAGKATPAAADAEGPSGRGEESAGRGDARDVTGGGGGGGRASEGTSTSRASPAAPSSARPPRATAAAPSNQSSARTSTGARLLPLWEYRPGAPPRQYALDGDAVRLLSPEEADALAEEARASRTRYPPRNDERVRTSVRTSVRTVPIRKSDMCGRRLSCLSSH